MDDQNTNDVQWDKEHPPSKPIQKRLDKSQRSSSASSGNDIQPRIAGESGNLNCRATRLPTIDPNNVDGKNNNQDDEHLSKPTGKGQQKRKRSSLESSVPGLYTKKPCESRNHDRGAKELPAKEKNNDNGEQDNGKHKLKSQPKKPK